MCDEVHAEHFRCNIARFVGTFGQLNAATLAATARVNLRLHHNDVAAELLCRVISLFRRARNDPARNGTPYFLRSSFP